MLSCNNYRDPPFSVCGCDSAPSQTEPQVCEFFSPLEPENATAECPAYSFNENRCASAWLACLLPSVAGIDFCDVVPFLKRENITGCSQLEPPTNATGSICNNTLSTCYSVDGLSADVLKVLPIFTVLIEHSEQSYRMYYLPLCISIYLTMYVLVYR